jgi:eukaryotic-like serine/threonine-protein kinase
MNAPSWDRVKHLFQAALDRPPAERSAYLHEQCGDDRALQAEVESLLATHEQAGAFAGRPELELLGALDSDNRMAAARRALHAGDRLGVYKIQALIGAGGMGEVYRARDSVLGRDVAVKVIAPAFATDADRLARFEREARVLAALNHSHIGAIYGVENLDSVPVLVLELVEGETLAERIARRDPTLTVGAAIDIALQIADALEAAHQKGIVHRDLKPANIKITAGGAIKVLDFGIAKAGAAEGDRTDIATFSLDHTGTGLLLGTAAYMSPEQARGQPVDKRADVWAFGCILFEMLTGRQAFAGSTVSDRIAAVLEREPDWSALPDGTPPPVHRLLRRCLEKDHNRRLHDIADARIELEDLQRAGESAAVIPEPAPWWRAPALWWTAALVATTAVVVAVVSSSLMRRATAAEPIRFTLSESEARHLPDFPYLLSVSPDGRHLAFVSGEMQDKWTLNVRALGSPVTQALAGTERAFNPFWSPDSRFIGFTTNDGKLKIIDAAGGPAVTLVDGADGRAAWGSQGVILFERFRSGFVSNPGVEDGRLYRLPAAGGQPVPATELDRTRHELQHTAPAFLPDGRRFLYTALSRDPAESGVYLASLDSPARTRLLDIISATQYASGHLLYQRDGALMAQPFEAKKGLLTGDAVRLVDSVDHQVDASAAFSISETGVLAYRTGVEMSSVLTWFDRSGRTLETVGDLGEYQYPQLSPDGHRVVFARADNRQRYSLWQLDLSRNVAARFTFHPEFDFFPVVWSPDGHRVIYTSNRTGIFDLYQRDADGSGQDELLYASPRIKIPFAFSPDGSVLLFGEEEGPGRRWDIWALPMSGDRKPVPVVQSPYSETQSMFSPDGRWIAYESDDSGTMQVVAQAYPPTGAVVRLSTTTGRAPVWLVTGEVVYATADQHLMSVAVTTSGGKLQAGTPRELFAQRYIGGRANRFNVDASGRRFLLPVPREEPGGRPINVIINWTSLLPQR